MNTLGFKGVGRWVIEQTADALVYLPDFLIRLWSPMMPIRHNCAGVV